MTLKLPTETISQEISRELRRATLHLCFSKPHMDLSGFAQLRQKASVPEISLHVSSLRARMILCTRTSDVTSHAPTQVRLCGLWADIPGKAATAVRCLLKRSSPARKSHSSDSVGAAQPKLVAASVDGNHQTSGVSEESTQPAVFAAEEAVALGSDVLLGQSLSIRLTWELARARMLALQEVSARGGDVTASVRTGECCTLVANRRRQLSSQLGSYRALPHPFLRVPMSLSFCVSPPVYGCVCI